MPLDALPRFRLSVAAPETSLVVRGDELDPENLRADAARFFRRYAAWGRFGISAFLAATDEEIGSLCESRLVRFPTVAVFRKHDLEAVEIEVVATFRTPHVPLAHRDLDRLVEGITSCNYVEKENPFFEPDQ